MSDERKAEKKARNREKRANKKAALLRVLSFVKGNTKDTELLQAVELLTPGQRGFVSRTGAMDVLKAMFQEKGKLTETEIFSEFKFGRPKMNGICRNFIKKAKSPEERIWVVFDIQNETYVMVATGAEAPEGWTGYKPVDVDELEVED